MADKKNSEKIAKAAASASLTVHPVTGVDGVDEEGISVRSWRSAQYLRKRRCALWCCGCCGATAVILGVIAVILAFTVFKVKDPELTMNSIHVDSLSFAGILSQSQFSVNATLTADVSIKNPNVASFKFDQSTTGFFYDGQTIGFAYVPAGNVRPHRTARMNVTVDVLADRAAAATNITPGGMLFGQELNVTSYTEIKGRVNVLEVYKRDVHVLLNCSMAIDVSISSQYVQNMICVADVK